MKRDSLPAEQQRISSVPEICEFGRCRPGDIIVLACDGVFDVLSSKVVADMALQGLSGRGDPTTVVKEVVGRALQAGSRDNVTCLAAQLLSGLGPLRQSTF
jgi:serine/threonine protein phosphatase PrpC